jgi:hypothetical protein
MSNIITEKKYLSLASNALGLTPELAGFLFARVAGFLGQGVSKHKVMTAIAVILPDILRQIQKSEPVIKNKIARRYKETIKTLQNQGWGHKAISNYLFDTHRAKISPTTLKKYFPRSNNG